MIDVTELAVVYVLRCGESNLFKIGRTLDLERRMRTLATGNPEPLSLFVCIETEDAALAEKYLHNRLRSRRSQRSLAREFFEIDADELTAIIDDARDFLDDYVPKRNEAEQFAKQESDGRVLMPTEADWQRYASLLSVRQTLDEVELQRLTLEAELKMAIGTAEGLEGIATWPSQSRTRFDRDGLRDAEPDLFERFLVVERLRQFRLR